MVKLVLLVLSIASVFSAVGYAQAPGRIVDAIDSSRAVALAKSVHPKAQAQFDQGAVEPSFELSYVTLTTTPSVAQQKALNRLLAQQQDPASPNYHRWLTPAEYADRFGLSRADINRITTWLKSQGFTILSVGSGRNMVIFGGTAAQVENAFKTQIHRYEVDGEQHFANSTPVMIPAALNGIVTGIRGLHDFRPKPFLRTRAFRGIDRPAPDYYDVKWQFPNFLAPADINTIYDIPSDLDGTGQTIAIVGDSDIFEADIDDFRKGFGLSNTNLGCTVSGSSPGPAGVITACNGTNFQYAPVGTDTPPNVNGDVTEADLDVEWAGSIAPKAKIIFVNAPNTSGGAFDALVYAISPNGGSPLAQIISVSFGGCEYADIGAGSLETQLAQAAGEGVTVLVASGDQGGAPCDGNPPAPATPPFLGAIYGGGVDYPASSPNVIAVGGTSISYANDSNPPPSTYWNAPTTNLANGGTAKTYIPELTWDDSEDLSAYCLSTGANPGYCVPPHVAVAVTSPQTAQEDYWISATGGGMSNCAPGLTQNASSCVVGFPQPAYQQTLSVPGAPSGTQYRYVPDVSLLASDIFPGYVFCTPQNQVANTTSTTSSCDPGSGTAASGIFTAVDTYHAIVGGTSAATPAFAAMVALLSQSLSTSGLGNINTNLYKLAATPSNHVFHQVNSGSNIVYCQKGLPAGEPVIACPASGQVGFLASNADATTGYNLVSGLGSVDVGNLVANWSATQSPTTTTVSPSLSQTYQSNSVTLTATVTATSGTTAPTGSVTFSYTNGTGGGTLGSSTLPSSTTTSAVATLSTTSLPVGTNTITATYNGNDSTSNGQTTVKIVAAFTLAANAQTYTVSPGQSATVNITVNTNQSGFSGNLSYTCTEPSTLTESTCTGPTSAVPYAQGASFLITTMAPTGALRRPFDRQQIFYAVLLPSLFGIMFTFGSRKRRLKGMRMLGLIVVLGFSTLWLGSCGGNNSSQSNPGTAPGNYSITINAESGSGQVPGATGTVTVTLDVQ